MNEAALRDFLDDDADEHAPAVRGATLGYVTPMSLLGPAPCDDCPFAARCASWSLACERFARYCDGESEARWRSAASIPTRRRFNQLFQTSRLA